MRKILAALDYLQKLDPESEIIAGIYVKDDLDDFNLTDNQWHTIVRKSENLDWYSDVKDFAFDFDDED